MKFCDHVEYTEENKTYTLSSTINLQGNQAVCSACNAEVDLSPLTSGGCNITGDWAKSE